VTSTPLLSDEIDAAILEWQDQRDPGATSPRPHRFSSSRADTVV